MNLLVYITRYVHIIISMRGYGLDSGLDQRSTRVLALITS